MTLHTLQWNTKNFKMTMRTYETFRQIVIYKNKIIQVYAQGSGLTVWSIIPVRMNIECFGSAVAVFSSICSATEWHNQQFLKFYNSFRSARLVPKITSYLSCSMMMMVIVIPSVMKWQLWKAMSFHSLRAFFKLSIPVSFLAPVGCYAA
jgi:uncharacterized protein (DUF2132 family)